MKPENWKKYLLHFQNLLSQVVAQGNVKQDKMI